MSSKITSIRSNPMPAQGSAATQPVPPNQSPASMQELIDYLTPALSRFRSMSSPLRVPLDTITFGGLGDQKQVRIASVGLGERVVAWHTAVINLANSAAGAQTVNFSPHFPWNMLSNTAVQINGGETTYSCSGRAGLGVWARDRAGFWQSYIPGGNGLPPALVQMSVGANLTLNLQPTTAASFTTLSGGLTISVAATSNGNLTVSWATVEKLAHGRHTLLGALPLQNNSTFATVTRNVVGSLTTTAAASQADTPFYNAGANITSSLTSYTVLQMYHFWGIPSDPTVYQPLIENSYQVIEAKSMTAAAVGTAAITYNIPQNAYVTALHTWAKDNNGTALVPATAFTRLALQYNAGSVIPVVAFPERDRPLQFADYDADLFLIPGYRLWDGHQTAELLDVTDDAGWIDTYAAAEPQLVHDLGAAVVTPVVYNITREAIVAGAVQQLGG